MSAELTACKKWIMKNLTGSAALTALVGNRIYHRRAQQGSAFPYVIFAFQSSTERLGSGAARIFTRPAYLVKAVGNRVSDADLEAISELVDQILISAPQDRIGGVYVLSAYRETAIEYDELLNNERVNHVGGTYRLYCHRG